MPINPQIISGLQLPEQQPFNPLATLQQLGQIRQQAQERQIREGQIAEQQRKLAAEQKAKSDQQIYEQLVQTPGLTPETLLDAVQKHAPDKYQEVATWKSKLEEQASLVNEHIAATKAHDQAMRDSAAKAQISLQELGANTWAGVRAMGDSPMAFHGAELVLRDAFKDFPPMLAQLDQYSQAVASGTPISQIVDAGLAQNRQVQQQANESPTQRANAVIQGQVAAGTQNGLTPEQQKVDADRQANLRVRQGELAVAQQREGREQQTAKQTNTLFDTSQGTGPTAVNPGGARNEDFLKTLPTATADLIKRVVEGRQPLPTRFAANDTYWHTVLDLAGKYDPSFDAVNYNSRSKTRAAFTSGKEAAQVNTLNTAIEHLAELQKVADALKDTGFTPLNYLANKAAGTVTPAVNNFNTVTNRVAPELVSAYRGGGGAEADITRNLKDFSISNTHEMNRNAIAETAKLLESKIKMLEQQYQSGMGTDAVSVVSPAARRVLDSLSGKPAASGGSGPTQGQVRPIPGFPNNHEKFDGKNWIRID